MKRPLKLLIVLFILGISFFIFTQSVWDHTNSPENISQTKKQQQDSSKNKIKPLNIKRINTRLVDAEINDRDDVLKEFLITKGVFDGNKPIDISGIKTLTFEDLSNLELITVSYLPNLIELNIAGTLVSDLECLTNLSGLKHLNISNTSVESIGCLKQSQLQTLIMSQTSVIDFEQIGKIRSLEYLDVSKCNINEISSLKNLKNLIHLDISSTKISDLSPLISLKKIKKINYTGSSVIIDSDNIELILRTR